MSYRYWTLKLNQEELSTYKNIVEAIKTRKTSAKCSGNINLRKVMQCVYDDYPEFFYVSHRFEYQQSLFGMKVLFNYTYSYNESLRIQDRINSEVANFMATKIIKGMTDYEKELVIYEYLASEVSYDMQAAMSDRLNGYEDAHTIVGVFVHKKAVCDGIASAFKYLCDVVKIPCIVISGEGENGVTSGAHAWNMVDSGGGFQHVDVTWDNQSISGRSIQTYIYLNMNDNEMRKEHRWDEEGYPKCREANMNYYVMNDAIVGTRRSMIRYIVQQLNNREETIMFRIDDASREGRELLEDLGSIIQEAMGQTRNIRIKGMRSNILNTSKIIILEPSFE